MVFQTLKLLECCRMSLSAKAQVPIVFYVPLECEDKSHREGLGLMPLLMYNRHVFEIWLELSLEVGLFTRLSIPEILTAAHSLLYSDALDLSKIQI